MKKQHLILIPDRLKPPADIERDVFNDDSEILTPCVTHTSAISDEIWRKVDAILAWHELEYTAEIIEKLESCRVIVRIGVGFDNVDLKTAGKQGIYVCNIPDYGTSDVADHAVALMLNLSRGVYGFSERVRVSNQNWHWDSAGKLHRLSGATLGVIGLGRIGTAVALRAKAFGIRVIFYDPYIADGQDKALGITRCDTLGELLNQVDLISIHTPLTSETKGVVNQEFFAMVKPGVILVNTARGAIIDLDALNSALQDGIVRGVGLDVLPEEPPDSNHPLIKDWIAKEPWIAYRMIITPHAAFYCIEAYEEMRRKAAQEAKRVLQGLSPRNCVNLTWLKG